jgi:hypothetical protein
MPNYLGFRAGWVIFLIVLSWAYVLITIRLAQTTTGLVKSEQGGSEL